MRKKTKLTKGGKTFLEKLSGKVYEGPYISDNINDNINKHKENELLNEYKTRKELAEKDLELITAKKDKTDKLDQLQRDRDYKYTQLNNNNFFKSIRAYGNIFLAISAFFKYIIDTLGKIFSFTIKTSRLYFNSAIEVIKGFFSLIGGTINIGDASLFKIILFILVIAIIAGVVISSIALFSGPTNLNISEKSFNNIQLDSSIKPPSFSNFFSTTINKIIPDSYKFKFNSIYFKFNKVLGYDVRAQSIYRMKREDEKNGRNDDLLYIKKQGDVTNVYNLVKPNDFNLKFDIKDYSGSDIDFYKLPVTIQNKFIQNSATSNLNINFKVNETTIDNGKQSVFNYKVDDNPLFSNDTIVKNSFAYKKHNIQPIHISLNNNNQIKYMFDYKDNKYIYPNGIKDYNNNEKIKFTSKYNFKNFNI
jgi:hypothetical protein